VHGESVRRGHRSDGNRLCQGRQVVPKRHARASRGDVVAKLIKRAVAKERHRQTAYTPARVDGDERTRRPAVVCHANVMRTCAPTLRLIRGGTYLPK
jgi:hypothetical protein